MKNNLTLLELAKDSRENPESIRPRVSRVLAEIEAKQPQLNSFLARDAKGALQAAKVLAQDSAGGRSMGPLSGIPFAVKDQIVTQGIETTCGSEILRGFIPPYQSTVVQRLKEAGAILVGKTNQDEFGMGSTTETSFSGSTFNPWDLCRVAGGSSGGSAVAVAARQVAFSLGTDTGGSIRQPASFTGVVGMKPTYGRVSRYGAIAYASSLDQIGPIGSCVQDVAQVLQVIAGHDLLDATSSKRPVPDYMETLEDGIQGLKIGLPREYFGAGVEAGVASAVSEGLARLEAAGATIVEIDLPHTPYVIPTYYILAMAEASSNLARYDGVRYGFREGSELTLDEMYSETRSKGFGKEVKRRIMLGTFALSSGYVDAYYKKAQQVRTLILRDFQQVFGGEGGVDLIASPTAPVVAWKKGTVGGSPLEMYQMDIFTTACNLAGLPGISVPCGFSSGMPVGLQLMGPAFSENVLLRAAEAHERRWLEGKQCPPLCAEEWMRDC